MSFFCKIQSIMPGFEGLVKIIPFIDIFLVILAFAGSAFLLWKMLKHISGIKKKTREQTIFRVILSTFLSLVTFTFVLFIIAIGSFIVLYYDNPPSGYYSSLNAAIKNTCILDPKRVNCPKTAQDIIKIEPQEFITLTRDVVLTYQYYPNTNQYTLIIRNKNIRLNNNRVAIFDPRLATVKNYGSGFDFYNAAVYECDGKYVLRKPPPFPGPWNNIN